MSAPVMRPGFTRLDMVASFAAAGCTRGAEIGVRQGAFSLALFQQIPGLQLLCVDPWRYYPTNPKQPSQDRQEFNYRVTQERLRALPATILRAASLQAAAEVPPASLDFVYIDGNHAYEYVRQDLAAWSVRVRSGGFVSGDDYDAPGVRKALHEWTQLRGIHEWWLTDDPRRKNRKGEIFTSWWWVQP